jgi:Recombination endonuclease VII
MSTTTIEPGYCHCGCGKKTGLARRDDPKKGWVKGQPLRFLRGHNAPKPGPTSCPIGFCECGCGRIAPLAPQTSRAKNWVKGQPLRYIQGHTGRKYDPDSLLLLYHNSSEWKYPIGLCQCGCGGRTSIAPKTNLSKGDVQGQPRRYLHGHVAMRRPEDLPEGPNPSGICQCGCGKLAAVAKASDATLGIVKGKPTRYARGHYPRNYCEERKRRQHLKCHLKKCFNLDIEDYDRMLFEQNYLCAICKRPERRLHSRTGVPQRLAVDHDPQTGRVRGLLCQPCNQAIGQLSHDREIVKSALEYLELHSY